ncbi:PE domain-containing protein [Saccharopolyspora sp. 5N708]|uniref:PE domain-containing protein n=1 Tax=Saccharopolyspora sp. 5N708 TaxID=3457424 RepID=UPI003FD492F0
MAFFDGIVTAVDSAKRMAVVHTAINSGGTATAASFSVDIEQIPGLIAKYEDAVEKLEQILMKAQQLRKVAPPGEDEVSEKLANSLGEMAGNNEGCLSWAVNDARKRLQAQIDQLKAAQGTYQSTDEAATARQV